MSCVSRLGDAFTFRSKVQIPDVHYLITNNTFLKRLRQIKKKKEKIIFKLHINFFLILSAHCHAWIADVFYFKIRAFRLEQQVGKYLVKNTLPDSLLWTVIRIEIVQFRIF